MDRQITTGLIGPMNVTRAVLLVMRKQRRGHVVTISCVKADEDVPAVRLIHALADLTNRPAARHYEAGAYAHGRGPDPRCSRPRGTRG
jgi:NAD(P)-dependent dehydrogenase (short-subunit alcohol dehydrogenase family)